MDTHQIRQWDFFFFCVCQRSQLRIFIVHTHTHTHLLPRLLSSPYMKVSGQYRFMVTEKLYLPSRYMMWWTGLIDAHRISNASLEVFTEVYLRIQLGRGLDSTVGRMIQDLNCLSHKDVVTMFLRNVWNSSPKDTAWYQRSFESYRFVMLAYTGRSINIRKYVQLLPYTLPADTHKSTTALRLCFRVYNTV